MPDQQEWTPDLSKPPNFDALRGWFDKLEKWTTEAAGRIHDLENDKKVLEEEVETLKQNAQEVKELEREQDSAKEVLTDVLRGIRTMDELCEEMGVSGP